jgi:hypothetical protein
MVVPGTPSPRVKSHWENMGVSVKKMVVNDVLIILHLSREQTVSSIKLMDRSREMSLSFYFVTTSQLRTSILSIE